MLKKVFLERNPNSLLTRGDFLFADTSEDLEGSGNFTCLDSDTATFAGYHTVIGRLSNRQNSDYKYILTLWPSSTTPSSRNSCIVLPTRQLIV
ncbi:hypothetical protein [Lunatimonas salinarum]|uniref:hypothetical protein n=1 Tax=Lunatimonas salinarum TaxID=1774590 RepID=UPI001ADF8FC4|nr:hypothetical protein [Lunatimonas salinarum]